MANDLGGDDRLVAFMQYLRVLIVVLATPLLVTIFGGGEGIGAVPNEDPLATPRDWLITAAVAPIAALARPPRDDPRRHAARPDGRRRRADAVRRRASWCRRWSASWRSR